MTNGNNCKFCAFKSNIQKFVRLNEIDCELNSMEFEIISLMSSQFHWNCFHGNIFISFSKNRIFIHSKIKYQNSCKPLQ